MFDREGSGYLEAKELKKVLLNLGEQMSAEEVEDMLKVANLDQDGQLNYRRKFLQTYGSAYEVSRVQSLYNLSHYNTDWEITQ